MSDDSSTTDGDLMRRALRDPRAFDLVYARHGRSIHAWLRRHVGSSDDAWELTAEVFAQAWLSRRRFHPDRDGNAAPWLHGIARNVLRYAARRRSAGARAMRRLGMQLDLTHPPDEDEELERIVVAQLGGELATSLAALPDAQREAITLRVFEELPYEAIAQRLDCTVEAVRMRVMRGLRTLGTDLAGRYP